jgi:hypothetical protein
MGTTDGIQGAARKARGGRRPGAGRKTKEEEFRAELRRQLATTGEPVAEPSPARARTDDAQVQTRADKPKARSGRPGWGGARPGAGRKCKEKIVETKTDLYAPFTPEEEAKLKRLFDSTADAEAEPAARAQEDGNGSKGGRPPKLADAEAYRAIDALGSRTSRSQLAKTLGCTRGTINNWVERKGFNSLEELVQSYRTTGSKDVKN